MPLRADTWRKCCGLYVSAYIMQSAPPYNGRNVLAHLYHLTLFSLVQTEAVIKSTVSRLGLGQEEFGAIQNIWTLNNKIKENNHEIESVSL